MQILVPLKLCEVGDLFVLAVIVRSLAVQNSFFYFFKLEV